MASSNYEQMIGALGHWMEYTYFDNGIEPWREETYKFLEGNTDNADVAPFGLGAWKVNLRDLVYEFYARDPGAAMRAHTKINAWLQERGEPIVDLST
jgi:hypothetical protein